jgi:hypothetical protein
MKIIVALIFLVTGSKIQAQKVFDTLKVNKNEDQIIFIDTPNSKFHHLVFSILLPELYQKDTINVKLEISKKLNSNSIGEWITIKKFKGKYFAYFPSEPYSNTYFRLTDSTVLINEFNEGFISYNIKRKKMKGGKLILTLIGDDRISHFISIKQKPDDIFKVKSSLFTLQRISFVKRQSYYKFPIIVNNCPNNRCQEFIFK